MLFFQAVAFGLQETGHPEARMQSTIRAQAWMERNINKRPGLRCFQMFSTFLCGFYLSLGVFMVPFILFIGIVVKKLFGSFE